MHWKLINKTKDKVCPMNLFFFSKHYDLVLKGQLLFEFLYLKILWKVKGLLEWEDNWKDKNKKIKNIL